MGSGDITFILIKASGASAHPAAWFQWSRRDASIVVCPHRALASAITSFLKDCFCVARTVSIPLDTSSRHTWSVPIYEASSAAYTWTNRGLHIGARLRLDAANAPFASWMCKHQRTIPMHVMGYDPVYSASCVLCCSGDPNDRRLRIPL